MENMQNVENLENNSDLGEAEYDPEIYTLVDEEGNQHDFEIIDEVEHDGSKYFALVPLLDEDEDSVEEQVVILKSSIVDGQEVMITIESQQEYETVGQIFFTRFQDIMQELNEDEAPEEIV